MSQNFTHIATVNFKHAYFRDGFFTSVNISMDADSRALMKDLGILLKPFSGGFHLLASNRDKLASENPEVSIKIHFDCSDSYYINYTNLGHYEPANDILYFSNLDAQFNSDEAVFLLHTDIPVPIG